MVKKEPDKILGDRIRYLREDVLGMKSQAEFGSPLRVTRGAVGNWELGQGIKAENLRKIAQTFGISFDWLATGNGERPVPGDIVPGRTYQRFDESEDAPASEMAGYQVDHYRPKIPGAVPELQVSIGAGEGNIGEVVSVPVGENNYSGHLVVAEWYLPDQFIYGEARVAPNRTVILPVVGDSMFPNYISGDRVLIDLSQNQLLQDAVYAISDGQSPPQIKRLQRVLFAKPERVKILSDNATYSSEEHDLANVQIIGRVCGVISRR